MQIVDRWSPANVYKIINTCVRFRIEYVWVTCDLKKIYKIKYVYILQWNIWKLHGLHGLLFGVFFIQNFYIVQKQREWAEESFIVWVYATECAWGGVGVSRVSLFSLCLCSCWLQKHYYSTFYTKCGFCCYPSYICLYIRNGSSVWTYKS